MGKSQGARYLPLAALIAAQLLIIAVVDRPNDTAVSTGGTPVAVAGGATGGATPSVATPAAGGTGGFSGSGTPTVSGGTSSGSGSTGGGGTTSSGGSGGAGTTGGQAAPAPGSGGGGGGGGDTGDDSGASPAAAGDTSHCVGDRQFDPSIDFYAPPCVAASDGTNPGDTYQGVSADEILMVRYYGQGDPALDAVLRAQDAFVEPEQHQEYMDAVADFVNANYELYGRSIRLEVFEGSCSTVPPDESCLQNDFRELVEAKQPFAVIWPTAVCSSCFAELSKLRTVNLGGWNFRDEFGQRWRPYHYDVTMSGTRLAQHAAELWCKQLAGRPAEYSRSFPDRNRQLGVFATNDPENQNTVEIDLKNALSACGEDFGDRTYFYAQNVSTADAQRRAGVLAMRGDAVDPTDDATSVMCFCDLVAPSFLYQEMDTQQYYPENIVPGTGFMDVDQAAQAYIGSVGCPQGSPCAFDGAFGFRSAHQEPIGEQASDRVWQAAGREGLPFASAGLEWSSWNLLASGIQMAGPNLTPETLEQGLFALGPRGDAQHSIRQITPNNYHWATEVDRVYWSSTMDSPQNGRRGTYVPLDDFYISPGDWPSETLALPPMPR